MRICFYRKFFIVFNMHTNIFAYIEDQRKSIIDDFRKLISYKTVSSRHDNAEEFKNASECIISYLLEADLDNVTSISDFGNPIIYAEKFTDPSLKTLLFYAHYDVQPAEPLDLWNTDPYELKVEDGEMYGRGVSDDKGMLIAVIKALDCILKNGMQLKYNVKILFEPCEEACSREIVSMFSEDNVNIQKYKDLFKCDAIVACDSAMSFEERPTLTIGIRGCVSCELVIIGPNRDIHSGQFGGCVGNPIHELCRLLSLMRDDNNHITIEHFYDKVNTTEEDMRSCDKYNIDEEEMKRDLGVGSLLYEKGFTPRQANRIRPTIEVNGIYGGHTGEGGKTIIPSKATAKISIRLVDEQDPVEIMNNVRSFIRKNIHPAFRYEIKQEDEGSGATNTDTSCEVYRELFKCTGEEYQMSVTEVKMGGSIPIMNTLNKNLGCNIVFFGTGSPNSNCHGPNEHLSIDSFFKAIRIIVRLLLAE